MTDAVSIHIAENRLERVLVLTQESCGTVKDTGQVPAGRWPRLRVPVQVALIGSVSWQRACQLSKLVLSKKQFFSKLPWPK